MRPKHTARSWGFSLIEVLVAMAVLSIGLLSLAALQASAVRHALGSFQHSVAQLQALDAVERLWASRCVLRHGQALDTLKAEWQAAHAHQPGNIVLPDWQGDIAKISSAAGPYGTYMVAVQWAGKPTRLDLDASAHKTQKAHEAHQISQTVNIPHHSC